jgi:hypothetical protein
LPRGVPWPSLFDCHASALTTYSLAAKIFLLGPNRRCSTRCERLRLLAESQPPPASRPRILAAVISSFAGKSGPSFA